MIVKFHLVLLLFLATFLSSFAQISISNFLFSNNSDEVFTDLIEDINGNLFITLRVREVNHLKHAGLVFKIDENGILLDSVRISLLDKSTYYK